MKIFIHDIQFWAHHGVLPQEQKIGANFQVSVEAETANATSTETDELADTVSYADMTEAIRQEMAIPSKLLEHAAGRIARRLLHDFPTLSRVRIRLTKKNPPIGLQCNGAGVEIVLTQENL